MVKMYISVSNHTHKKINKHKDWFLFILNINKTYTHKTWKQHKYHTVIGLVYIYAIPARDSKAKSKYPDENKDWNKFE